MKLERILAITSLLLLAMCFIGCGKQPEKAKLDPEVNAAIQAWSNSSIVIKGNNWYGLQTGGNIELLVCMRDPTIKLSRSRLSQADKLNGLEQRVTVNIRCNHYRVCKNGVWQDWSETPLGNTFSPIAGLQVEKRKGQLQTKPMGQFTLSQDTGRLHWVAEEWGSQMP